MSKKRQNYGLQTKTFKCRLYPNTQLLSYLAKTSALTECVDKSLVFGRIVEMAFGAALFGFVLFELASLPMRCVYVVFHLTFV